ncbi:MAG: type VI secretion system baseplate subunit TssG [Polyangiaceae bacterium]
MSFLSELAATPYEFDFHAALRRIEGLFKHLPRFGEAARPADEVVRIGQEPSLAFAPAALSAFTLPTEDQPGRLTVAFFGLFGTNGPLPLHLTEYVRERMRHAGDRTFSAFADLFHHRMLMFFHRAWAQADPTASADRPERNRFDTYVGSLFGIGMSALSERDAVPDRAKLQYAGWFASCVRSAEGLRAILSDYFELPVAIEEFQSEWLDLPETSRTRLGGTPDEATLGRSVVLGNRVRRADHKFRVRLGPLSSRGLLAHAARPPWPRALEGHGSRLHRRRAQLGCSLVLEARPNHANSPGPRQLSRVERAAR